MSDEEGGEDYEIERILADDNVEGQCLYLVKWKNYDDKECTWEPAENFNSPTSIAEWEDQKAKGLGLDDFFLAGVQQKMDEYQAQRQQSKDIARSNFPVPTKSSETEQRPTKKQKKTHDASTIPVQEPPKTRAEVPRKKGIAAAVKPYSFAKTTTNGTKASASGLPSLAMSSKPATTASRSKPDAFSKAGQRFRNLSHMNNYRKKANQERAPNLSPGRLKSIADFRIGREVAHILPPSLDKPSSNNDAALFIPDTNVPENRRSVSPVRSDSELFPPARVDHQAALITTDKDREIPNNQKPSDTAISKPQQQSNTLDAHTKDSSTSAIDVSRTIAIRKPSNNGHVGIASPVEATDIRPSFEVAPLPPHSTKVKAKNGRVWYRGDIMCSFAAGTPIGDATVIHVPYYPYGMHLVKLKSGEKLNLNFEPDLFNRLRFEEVFQNYYVQPEAIGLINPFSDMQQHFNDFAAHLEQHDAVAVFNYPDNSVYLSLVLYSTDSASWKTFGRCPARPDTDRPRLHLAFLPRLVSRTTPRKPILSAKPVVQPSSIVDRDAVKPVQQDAKTPLVTQRTRSLSRQPTRSPSVSHGVAELNIHQPETSRSPTAYSSGFSSVPQSPLDDTTILEASPDTMSPESPPSAVIAIGDPRRRLNKAVVGQTQNARLATSIHDGVKPTGRYRLSFKFLTSPYPLTSKVKLDSKKTQFFVSFAASHPEDSKNVQKWLEQYTQPSNIYLDSERHDWVRFKDKTESCASVILFHHDGPNYNKLPRLGQMLGSETPSCFSIKFKGGAGKKPDLHQASVKRIFPRRTMYLVTESMFVDYLDETIDIVKYFDGSKKPGYQIMMRPNIERWLLEYAASEGDQSRQDKLIDLLVLIRDLNPTPDCEIAVNANGDLKMAAAEQSDLLQRPSYIISPRSMPEYDQMPDRKSAISPASSKVSAMQFPVGTTRDHRDSILRSYFYCFTAVHAAKYRRFIELIPKAKFAQHEASMKQKEQDNTLDCGHIFFWELDKFVARHCRGQTDKKRQATGQGATEKSVPQPK